MGPKSRTKFPSLDEETKEKDKEKLFNIFEEKLMKDEKLPRLSPMMRNASFAERAKWLTSIIIEEQTKLKSQTSHQSLQKTNISSAIVPSSTLMQRDSSHQRLPIMQTIKQAKNRWKGVALSVSNELEGVQSKILASKRARSLFSKLVLEKTIAKVLSYSTLNERFSFACSCKMVNQVEQSRRGIANCLNEHAQIIFNILSFLPARQRSKLALTCKKWRNLLHPIDHASELKSDRKLSEQLNVLPQALDLVFLIDKRSPETPCFHCAQAIKHAVERIAETTLDVDIRVGVIVFNKYPDPLEESHWIKGGFPPSAYAQAKACVRNRNSVLDPATGMPISRFTTMRKSNDETIETGGDNDSEDDISSRHLHPMLGAMIKHPSFLTDTVDEGEKTEIQKSWKEILGKWLIDPLKRNEMNNSFVVKRFGFVDYEKPGSNKLRKMKAKQELKLIASHREPLIPKLQHRTSFNTWGPNSPESSQDKAQNKFRKSQYSPNLGGFSGDSGGNSFLFRVKPVGSKDSDFDEDEDIDYRMQMRSLDTLDVSPSNLILSSSRGGSRPPSQGSNNRPPSRGFEDSSAGYLEHLKKRIPHKRNEKSIGQWSQVDYKKVASFQDEFQRWQSEQRAKSEITELLRLAQAAKDREEKDKKVYEKLLQKQRRNLKGFELLIEKVAKILDKDYGKDVHSSKQQDDRKTNQSEGAASLDKEEEEDEDEEIKEKEEEDMNGSALGAALELLLGNQDLSQKSLKQVGPELVFRPHATKLCFLLSSSSPIALELHSKPPFQKKDPCGFDPIHALHEIADRGIRICPIVSKSVQNWDSALGFMQGVAKITKSSNSHEDKLTGGVSYIAPSELTAPYILQEALCSIAREMLDRDKLKHELLIKMNSIQSNDNQFSSVSKNEEVDEKSALSDGSYSVTSQLTGSMNSEVSSRDNTSNAAVDYRTWRKEHTAVATHKEGEGGMGIDDGGGGGEGSFAKDGHVIRMSNGFHDQVTKCLKLLQDDHHCVTWEQRQHDGKLPLKVSKRRLRQFTSPKLSKTFEPPPPSPHELANIYLSSSSALEAKLVLAEIEAEKVVRAQTVEVLAEVRVHVKENSISWSALSWCDRVKVCAEARKRIQNYTREMRVAKANSKVETRAKVMQFDRLHNTKFHLMLKDLCEGDTEAFAIFLQAKVRSFLIRQRYKRNKSKHQFLDDDISMLSSYSSNSFHANGSISDIFGESKLLSDNAFAEITYVSTEDRIITVKEAIHVLSFV